MNVRDLRVAFIKASTRFNKLMSGEAAIQERFDELKAEHDAKWNRPYIDDIIAITIANMSPGVKRELLRDFPEQRPLIEEIEIRQHGGM